MLAAAANFGAAAAVTSLVARRLGGRVLTAPNLLTLSRAGAAAMLCGTAFSGRGRRAGFWALLAACTVCDWVDGRMARRLGPSRLGVVLDIEADSWLTLWGAVAGVRLRRLPAASLLPPVLRYPMVAGRPVQLRLWQRVAGVAQMVVLAMALSPWRPPRPVTLGVAVAQAGALAASALGYPASHGPAANHVPTPHVGDAEADRSLRKPFP